LCQIKRSDVREVLDLVGIAHPRIGCRTGRASDPCAASRRACTCHRNHEQQVGEWIGIRPALDHVMAFERTAP